MTTRLLRLLVWSLAVTVGPGTLALAQASPAETKPAAAEPKEPALAKELVKRVATDQAARMGLIDFQAKHGLNAVTNGKKPDPKILEEQQELIKKLREEDARNQAWFKGVVEKHGWPGESLVGKQGASNAWLLVQHCDSDHDFQEQCLKKMEALPKGEVEPRELAYLTDRVLIGKGKKQKYGTQGAFKEGKITAAPIEDEAHVDERRKAVGLVPLAEYLKQMERFYLRPKPPQQPK